MNSSINKGKEVIRTKTQTRDLGKNRAMDGTRFLFSSMSSALLLGGLLLLYSGCTDFGEVPAGEYLFLTYTLSTQESLLVGDDRYIPRAVCEAIVPPYFKFDSVRKSLDIYNHVPFDVNGVQLLIWRANNLFYGLDFCPWADAIPVRNLPVAADSFVNILEISHDGMTRLMISGQEVFLSPHNSFTQIISQSRFVEGYYTIPPDTTPYPFVLQQVDVATVRNFGWCPRNLVSFKGW